MLELKDKQSRELFDVGIEGAREKYDGDLGLVHMETTEGSWHSPRSSLTFAIALLLTEDDASEAERIILKVLTMQERRDGDPHYGNFKWLYEDEAVTDLNAVEFVLEGLCNILMRCRERISEATWGQIAEAMRLGLQEIDNLNVHWTYTNIYLLDVHNRILGGQLLGDDSIAQRGLARLKDWAERTRADGAPHEFNSATYSAVQINALSSIVEFAGNAEARVVALGMEEFLWRHVAVHFHPPTLQLAGPHSRAYRRDVVGAPDYLKVLLYKLLGEPKLIGGTPYYDGSGREGNVIVAISEYNCPPDARALFERVETREVHETPDREEGLATVTYLTPAYALGTMSQPYGVGQPPEVWPGHDSCILYFTKQAEPGYGVLYMRYLVNDRRVGQFVYESSKEARDLWEEGTWRGAQVRNTAIVAYGLLARGQRHVHSLRLDLRLLGLDGEVIAGDSRYADGEVELPASEVVAIVAGDVYIGVRPLAPTRLGHGPDVRLWQDGQEQIVSIYNYDGPPRQFWEYRSLAGPFYKGNVRNGAVLRVADRAGHDSLEAFRDAFAAEPLVDTTEGSQRTISFGAGPDAVSLSYDLRELS